MMDVNYFKQHMYDVIGAIHEVHKELGPGLNEYCYQEGLEMQLKEQNIAYEREKSFHPTYHGKEMSAQYRLDFLCKGDIIVECKSVADIGNMQRAQLFNYLRLTGCACGILVNFCTKYATIERFLYDDALGEVLTMEGKIVRQI